MTTVSQTAQFELNNPYAKYGLKRRPTFEEIVGLISDDKRALQPLPNREATRFRNSPQGSFFDGADAMELLKEQQNRILDRQMRENIVRMQGGTHHLNMYNHNSSSSSTPSLQTAREITEDEADDMVVEQVALEQEMMMREEAFRKRQQETSRSFGQRLQEGYDSMMNKFLASRRPENIDIGTPTSIEEQTAQVERGSTPQNQPSSSTSGIRQQEPPSLPAPPPPIDELDDITGLEKRVAFINDFNPDTLKNDDSITYQGLLFQIYVRGLMTDNMIDMINKTPTKEQKKQLIIGIMEGLKRNKEWTADFNRETLQQKVKEFNKIRNRLINQPSSSSSGIGQAISSGLQEGAKAVAKAAAVKAGEMLVKKVSGT